MIYLLDLSHNISSIYLHLYFLLKKMKIRVWEAEQCYIVSIYCVVIDVMSLGKVNNYLHVSGLTMRKLKRA